MRIVSSAPGRAGIVGNPTDGYGGTVIACSLSERATVEIVSARETLLDVCGDCEEIAGPADLRITQRYTDVAKAVLSAFPAAATEHRFHLKARTEVPMKAGLAGSTAMLVAVMGAVLKLLDREMPRYEIAETARRIEFDILNVTCGFQDQYMAVCGGLCCVDLRGKAPTDPGPPIYATVERMDTMVAPPPLIVAHTGVEHDSNNVHSPLRKLWIEGDRDVVTGYETVAGLARQAKRAIILGDWARLGALMNENHAIQSRLGGSGEANDRMIQVARDAGALGAKLAGAGQGGTIIALHPEPERLISQLESAGATRILRLNPGPGLRVEMHA